MADRIHLGFEVGTGERVTVPLHHAIVSGVTGLSGKTTAISAMLSRLPDRYRSLVFSTKRGEISFEGSHQAQPFYKATVDWEYVSGVLEAARKEKLKFERSWIIKASRGAITLRDVYQNIVASLEEEKPLRGLDESVWTVLRAYFEKVLPELESQPWATSLGLTRGVNVMYLEHLSEEVQGLVIAASLEEAHRTMENVILVIPEAWAYVPQRRGSPVTWAAQHIIRQGRARNVFLWLDSQDVTTVRKDVLKSVDLWVLGRQRELNEVRRILDQIPATQKPKPSDVMTLGVGRFFVAAEEWCKKTYIQPAWMDEENARKVALGETPVVQPPARAELVPVFAGPSQLLVDHSPASGPSDSTGQLEEPRTLPEEEDPEEDPMVIADLQVMLNEVKDERDSFEQRLDASEDRSDEFQAELGMARIQIAQLIAEVEGARRLRQALREFLGTAWALEHADRAEPVDEEAIVEKVLARVGTLRPVLQVTPLEALRHTFQQETVARLVAQAETLEDHPRQAILWLLSTGRTAKHQEICRSLGFPRAGGGYVKFCTGVKKAVEMGVLGQSVDGLHVTIRETIVAELASYSPSPDDTEATYQHVLAVLAKSGGNEGADP